MRISCSICHTIPATAGVELCWAVVRCTCSGWRPGLEFSSSSISAVMSSAAVGGCAGQQLQSAERLLDVHPSWCCSWEWAERVEWCPALLLFTRNDRGISKEGLKPRQMRSGYNLKWKFNSLFIIIFFNKFSEQYNMYNSAVKRLINIILILHIRR